MISGSDSPVSVPMLAVYRGEARPSSGGQPESADVRASWPHLNLPGCAGVIMLPALHQQGITVRKQALRFGLSE